MKTIRRGVRLLLSAMAIVAAGFAGITHIADAALRASIVTDDDAPRLAARRAPVRVPFDEDEVAIPPPALPHHGRFAQLPDTERQCLARAVYFEARGEPLEGRIAVAQVVLNRVAQRRWRPTICTVINQGIERGAKCQFSFACWASSRRVLTGPLWEQAQQVADDVLAGRLSLPQMAEATHYHRAELRPVWRQALLPIQQIGAHMFYANAPSAAVASPRPVAPTAAAEPKAVAAAALPPLRDAIPAGANRTPLRQAALRPPVPRPSAASVASAAPDWISKAFAR